MCLGLYLSSDAKLDPLALNQLSEVLVTAPEPAPWAMLSECCVVMDRVEGCACVLTQHPELLQDPEERDRAERAARDLRRLADAASRNGRAALIAYWLGDEDKTPVEATVACASYFGDDRAWLRGGGGAPLLYWIGAPADRPEAWRAEDA